MSSDWSLDEVESRIARIEAEVGWIAVNPKSELWGSIQSRLSLVSADDGIGYAKRIQEALQHSRILRTAKVQNIENFIEEENGAILSSASEILDIVIQSFCESVCTELLDAYWEVAIQTDVFGLRSITGISTFEAKEVVDGETVAMGRGLTSILGYMHDLRESRREEESTGVYSRSQIGGHSSEGGQFSAPMSFPTCWSFDPISRGKSAYRVPETSSRRLDLSLRELQKRDVSTVSSNSSARTRISISPFSTIEKAHWAKVSLKFVSGSPILCPDLSTRTTFVKLVPKSSHHSSLLFAAMQNGRFAVWHVPWSGSEASLIALSPKLPRNERSPISDIRIGCGGSVERIVTISELGDVKVWRINPLTDIKNGSKRSKKSFVGFQLFGSSSKFEQPTVPTCLFKISPFDLRIPRLLHPALQASPAWAPSRAGSGWQALFGKKPIEIEEGTMPTCACFHPSMTLLASHPSVLVGSESGNIIKFNIDRSNDALDTRIPFLPPFVNVEYLHPAAIKGDVIMTKGDRKRKGNSVNREIFQFHRRKIVYLNVLSRLSDTFISVDEEGLLAVWKYTEQHFTGSGLFRPAATISLDLNLLSYDPLDGEHGHFTVTATPPASALSLTQQHQQEGGGGGRREAGDRLYVNTSSATGDDDQNQWTKANGKPLKLRIRRREILSGGRQVYLYYPIKLKSSSGSRNSGKENKREGGVRDRDRDRDSSSSVVYTEYASVTYHLRPRVVVAPPVSTTTTLPAAAAPANAGGSGLNGVETETIIQEEEEREAVEEEGEEEEVEVDRKKDSVVIGGDGAAAAEGTSALKNKNKKYSTHTTKAAATGTATRNKQLQQPEKDDKISLDADADDDGASKAGADADDDASKAGEMLSEEAASATEPRSNVLVIWLSRKVYQRTSRVSVEDVKLSEGDGDELFFLVTHKKTDPSGTMKEIVDAAAATVPAIEERDRGDSGEDSNNGSSSNDYWKPSNPHRSNGRVAETIKLLRRPRKFAAVLQLDTKTWKFKLPFLSIPLFPQIDLLNLLLPTDDDPIHKKKNKKKDNKRTGPLSFGPSFRKTIPTSKTDDKKEEGVLLLDILRETVETADDSILSFDVGPILSETLTRFAYILTDREGLRVLSLETHQEVSSDCFPLTAAARSSGTEQQPQEKEQVPGMKPKRSFWSKRPQRVATMESFKAASSTVCASQRVFALCGGAEDARIAVYVMRHEDDGKTVAACTMDQVDEYEKSLPRMTSTAKREDQGFAGVSDLSQAAGVSDLSQASHPLPSTPHAGEEGEERPTVPVSVPGTMDDVPCASLTAEEIQSLNLPPADLHWRCDVAVKTVLSYVVPEDLLDDEDELLRQDIVDLSMEYILDELDKAIDIAETRKEQRARIKDLIGDGPYGVVEPVQWPPQS